MLVSMRDDPRAEPLAADTPDAAGAAARPRRRAARGDRLAEQLADDTRKEPPVE